MATQDSIALTLETLAKAKGKEIEIPINNKPVKRLLELLHEEELIKIESTNAGIATVTVPGYIVSIKAIREQIFARYSELREWAIKLQLRSITGVIILSTNRGLMTHYQAMESKVGGRIVGVVY